MNGIEKKKLERCNNLIDPPMGIIWLPTLLHKFMRLLKMNINHAPAGNES